MSPQPVRVSFVSIGPRPPTITRRATNISRSSPVAAKFIVDGSDPVELGPGQLLFFRRNVVHSIPEIIEGPLVVFSVDTPRRDPADVTFVDPRHGTAANFIRTIKP